ncbi:M15 family metallopeptidase [Streptomyces sp. NPDC015492]|uniref:M15 family metallopeptidase n=1 Tax=Streptomyces sp. NPDC015492 TaxID=3364958 RepID=UPI0036F4FC45
MVSTLGTVAWGTAAVVAGSLLQAGLSPALPGGADGAGPDQVGVRSAANVPVTVTGTRSVVSERTAKLKATVPASAQDLPVGTQVEWQSRAAGTAAWGTVERLPLTAAGQASVEVSPWKTTEYRAVIRTGGGPAVGTSAPFLVSTEPEASPVAGPEGVPEPRFDGSSDPSRRPRAVGKGAHAVVSSIADPVWSRMSGVSAGEDCPVGRNDLRYVQVNYWGFDGYRYRGEIVVNESIAQATAAAFTDLYRLRYPIRQMRLADDFGKDAVKGADDYAAMSADNTSGFNCRYVDGKEADRVLSPHSRGVAIDINTWENPFQAKTGVFPDSAYLDRGIDHEALISGPESPIAQVFESRGLVWGGRWTEKDYHHFEAPAAVRPEDG